MGYRPEDFGLQRIFIGGEIVTEGLKSRSHRLFGQVEFVENYAMTETAPLGGSVCSEGHLHFEPSRGLVTEGERYERNQLTVNTGRPRPRSGTLRF